MFLNLFLLILKHLNYFVKKFQYSLFLIIKVNAQTMPVIIVTLKNRITELRKDYNNQNKRLREETKSTRNLTAQLEIRKSKIKESK